MHRLCIPVLRVTALTSRVSGIHEVVHSARAESALPSPCAMLIALRHCLLASPLLCSLALMGCFVFLLLRPFLTETANETRRIAELLSQLPAEVRGQYG
jgi:hypothetical protein